MTDTIETSKKFILHPQLKNDTFLIGSFGLSDVLLMNDIRYPWIILVPRCHKAFDITNLTAQERVVFRKKLILRRK